MHSHLILKQMRNLCILPPCHRWRRWCRWQWHWWWSGWQRWWSEWMSGQSLIVWLWPPTPSTDPVITRESRLIITSPVIVIVIIVVNISHNNDCQPKIIIILITWTPAEFLFDGKKSNFSLQTDFTTNIYHGPWVNWIELNHSWKWKIGEMKFWFVWEPNSLLATFKIETTKMGGGLGELGWG